MKKKSFLRTMLYSLSLLFIVNCTNKSYAPSPSEEPFSKQTEKGKKQKWSKDLLQKNVDKNNKETLVLFVEAAAPIMSVGELKQIESLAKKMELNFVCLDVSEGAPEEVTTTPSIYFQNELGSSKYYGRYSNVSRLKNFIRSSKLAHQKKEKNELKGLVWKNGKANILLNIKVTDLEGAIPSGFNQGEFKAEVIQAFSNKLKNYKWIDSFNADKNTKKFYVNLYPYLNESKELSFTTELFSAYNCVKPIFKRTEQPLFTGKWKKRETLCGNAAAYMEGEITKKMKYSEIGDAFNTVKVSNKIRSWRDLGLVVSKKETTRQDTKHQDYEIPRKWKMEQRKDKKDPIMIFSFLSPVDNYAGEVKEISGEMTLGPDLSMSSASGKFTVDVSAVTMGAEDFDYEVQNKMLKMSLFPSASFEFSKIKEGRKALRIGEEEALKIEGQFTMIGISIPVIVDTTIEPFVAENDQVKLQVSGTFELPLFDQFKIEGPDGPSPAKDRLQFYMKFNLE